MLPQSLRWSKNQCNAFEKKKKFIDLWAYHIITNKKKEKKRIFTLNRWIYGQLHIINCQKFNALTILPPNCFCVCVCVYVFLLSHFLTSWLRLLAAENDDDNTRKMPTPKTKNISIYTFYTLTLCNLYQIKQYWNCFV